MIDDWLTWLRFFSLTCRLTILTSFREYFDDFPLDTRWRSVSASMEFQHSLSTCWPRDPLLRMQFELTFSSPSWLDSSSSSSYAPSRELVAVLGNHLEIYVIPEGSRRELLTMNENSSLLIGEWLFSDQRQKRRFWRRLIRIYKYLYMFSLVGAGKLFFRFFEEN